MTPRIENEARIDVLAVLNNALEYAASADFDGAEQEFRDLKAARDAVGDLIALVGAMVETDRLVGRDDIANLFWPAFVEDTKKILARVKP